MRTFYRDETKATGWNNLAFPNIAMPHVLWELQGVRTAKFVDVKDPHDATKTVHKFAGYEQVKPGTMSALDYDTNMADLVGYMEWMAEPAANKRKQLGVIVLLFLSMLVFLAWRLNASYWKEVK